LRPRGLLYLGSGSVQATLGLCCPLSVSEPLPLCPGSCSSHRPQIMSYGPGLARAVRAGSKECITRAVSWHLIRARRGPTISAINLFFIHTIQMLKSTNWTLVIMKQHRDAETTESDRKRGERATSKRPRLKWRHFYPPW